MGIQGVLRFQINCSFSWVSRRGIVLLVLPQWKALPDGDGCSCTCLNQVEGSMIGKLPSPVLFSLWCELEGFNVPENNSINSAFSKLF